MYGRWLTLTLLHLCKLEFNVFSSNALEGRLYDPVSVCTQFSYLQNLHHPANYIICQFNNLQHDSTPNSFSL